METLNTFAKTNTAARIRSAAANGALSHALIFSGSGDRLAAAKYAACAMVHGGAKAMPCLRTLPKNRRGYPPRCHFRPR